MMIFKTFLLSFLLLLNTGCTRVGLSVLNAPTYSDTVVATKDIFYGPLKEQKLDIYAPRDTAGKKPDVVVFLYGGRWESGARADYRFAGVALAQQGFIVVVPDYRKYPDVKFPAFVEDGARALAWTADHIGEYGGNSKRLHVAGHSSGAHIGALLATDNRYLKTLGKDRSIITSFVGMAGPYSFTPDEDDLKDMFGPPDNYPQMQATHFVDGKEPPMLLLYGDKDTAVKQYNLDRMVAAIQNKKGCVRSVIYPNIGHVDLVVALSWYGQNKAPVLQDMADFMHQASHCKR